MNMKILSIIAVLLALAFGVANYLHRPAAADKPAVAAAAPPQGDARYQLGERLPDTPASPGVKEESQAPFEEVAWFALAPKGWDPMKNFSEGMADFTDADPRAVAALEKLREEWDKAPVEPSMHGARIRIAGFAVPLDAENGQLKEFLLVPYFGACIHTPPPPANQIILVRATRPVENVKVMDPVWVSGVLEIAPSRTSENTMGLAGSVGYRIKGEAVAPYIP